MTPYESLIAARSLQLDRERELHDARGAVADQKDRCMAARSGVCGKSWRISGEKDDHIRISDPRQGFNESIFFTRAQATTLVQELIATGFVVLPEERS